MPLPRIDAKPRDASAPCWTRPDRTLTVCARGEANAVERGKQLAWILAASLIPEG